MPAAIPIIIKAVVAVVAKITISQVIQLGFAIAVQFIGAKKSKRGGSSNSRRGLTLMVRESDFPRRVIYGKARVGGIWFYVETTGNSNEYVHLVLGISEGPNGSLEKLYFSEEEVALVEDGQDSNGVTRYKVDEGTYAGLVSLRYHNGAQTLADADLIADSAGNWTADHKLLGISYVVLKLKYSQSAFSNGLPEMSFLINGRSDILDPRDGTTKFSTNAALCLAHYQSLEKFGPGANYMDEINQPQLIASANICDERVSKSGGGDEPRYAVNGVVTTEDNPEDIMNDFLVSMGGWAVFSEGRFTTTAGVYETPSFEITEDMMVGPVTLKNKSPKRDRSNIVKGLYTAKENRYQKSNFPARQKQSYIDADGEPLIKEMDLEMVSSPGQAQRVANIELEKGRFEKVVTLTCNLRGFPAQTGKNVMLTIPRYGWNKKVFQVLSFGLGYSEDGFEIELQLKETSPTIYEWNTADEVIIQAAPDISNEGTKVAPLGVTPVGGVFLTTDFPLSVEVVTATQNANIRYSKAAIPASSSSANEYIGPIIVQQNDVIFARGFKLDHESSNVSVNAYTVEQVETPVATPTGGVHTFPLNVTLQTATPGASIRYSLSSEPTSITNGTEYTAPFAVANGQTVYAKAFKVGLLDSAGITETYTSS